MQNYLRDMRIRNVVITDEALTDLNAALVKHAAAIHNTPSDNPQRLVPVYIVRFDSRGYRFFNAEEAVACYKNAKHVERVVLGAQSASSLQGSAQQSDQIEVWLDSDDNANSRVVVTGHSKQWVEEAFADLERVIARHGDLLTACIRTKGVDMVVQLAGFFGGMLAAVWLATLVAPALKALEYPTAAAFALFFIVWSSVWPYLHPQLLAGISRAFPSVRFSRRGGEHLGTTLAKSASKWVASAVLIGCLGILSDCTNRVIGTLTKTSANAPSSSASSPASAPRGATPASREQ